MPNRTKCWNLYSSEVEIQENNIDDVKNVLISNLLSLGFDLIDDKKSQIIEKIKNVIIDLVHHQDNDTKHNLSEVLISQLPYDYNYLSNLFSEIEGTTIEKIFYRPKNRKSERIVGMMNCP